MEPHDNFSVFNNILCNQPSHFIMLQCRIVTFLQRFIVECGYWRTTLAKSLQFLLLQVNPNLKLHLIQIFSQDLDKDW